VTELEGMNTTCFVCGEDYESAEHTLFCPNSLAAVYYTPSMLPEVDDSIGVVSTGGPQTAEASEYVGVGPETGPEMRSDAEELFKEYHDWIPDDPPDEMVRDDE